MHKWPRSPTEAYFWSVCQWRMRYPVVECPICDWKAWESTSRGRLLRLIDHTLTVHRHYVSDEQLKSF